MTGTTTHQEYVEAIKKSAISTGTKVLVVAVSTYLPFLRLPVIKELTEFCIEKLMTVLVNETEFGLFFMYIDMRTDAQGRAFSQAAINNYNAQKNGTPDEKLAAEKELIAKFRAFVIIRN